MADPWRDAADKLLADAPGEPWEMGVTDDAQFAPMIAEALRSAYQAGHRDAVTEMKRAVKLRYARSHERKGFA